jgi:hypothetical protein
MTAEYECIREGEAKLEIITWGAGVLESDRRRWFRHRDRRAMRDLTMRGKRAVVSLKTNHV